MAETKKESCPFQYDATFAFGKVIAGDNMKQPMYTGGDGDDGDDESDDDDDDEEKLEYFDCFGAIKKKLTDHDCLFVNESFLAEIKESDDGLSKDQHAADTARIFNVQFDKFPEKKHLPLFYFETSRQSIIPGKENVKDIEG